ncbi:RNA methyltransferase [bacterium]|nr:RNA methyltransferase [bacterium]
MIQPRLEPVVAWGPAPVPPPLPKGRLLVLDIQDPGNLGTLIRSARGLGVEGVALLPRCPDLYNPRVLRASAGTLFGYPVGAWTESLLKDRTLFVAEAHGGNPVPSPPPQEWLLVLGHETTGTSPLFLGRGVSLTLTLTGVESLGVAAAGAVLMDRLT